MVWVAWVGLVSVAAVLVGLHGLAWVHLLVLWARSDAPAPVGGADLPVLTVQLPVYNEAPVVQALLRCVGTLDWPRDRPRRSPLSETPATQVPPK